MNWFLKDNVDKAVTDKVDNLKAYTDGLGITTTQFALAWCLRKKNVTSAIIGATKKTQVDENCKASGIEFTPEMENKVKEIFYT